MSIWQPLLITCYYTYQFIILFFAFVFRPPPFAHAPCPHSTRPNHIPVPPRRQKKLELIQTHMTQKPLLWVEVGAHAVRKRSKCAGVILAGAGVPRRHYLSD
jgi:hypothetical protein